jgi:hypothetical protein
MAGEWIPYDVCLPHKPEVLELVDMTGLEVDQVVGRLVLLWGWASLNSSDGTARLSVRLLCRLCGGDEAFWESVQSVGWLVIDAEAGTVAIPGWERRFSKTAKSRAMETARNQAANAKKDTSTRAARTSTRAARAHNARGASERRDRGDRISSSSPEVAALEEPGSGPSGPPGWETLREAWRAGKGRPWALPTAPDRAADRLAEDGWFEKALAAIDRLPACKYFRDPVTLPQFVAPGFVDKILGGQFDNARDAARGPARLDDRPPPQEWRGEDAARFEATKRAMADKLRAMESGVGSVDS